MNREAEDKLQELYEELAGLIPEALAEDFIGMGYAKGRFYDNAEKRILIVEKAPRPQKYQIDGDAHCDCHSHDSHSQHREDEKDFTGVVSRIAQHFFGGKNSNWQDSIAWTYLYKLVPKKGKPDEFVYKKQKQLCEKIITMEIEVLNPTHVLFFTGWGGIWNFGLPLASVLKGEAVEGWGKTEDGKNLIVTRYAIRKPEEKFTLDILEKIKLIEEA